MKLPLFILKYVLTVNFPPLINCICFVLLIFLSPLLVLVYSTFSIYPSIPNSSFFHNMNDLNALFYKASLYIYITLRFSHNILLHTIANPRFLSKLTKYLTALNYSLQVCLFINQSFDRCFLSRCGDIETNPGPDYTSNSSFSVCHWNLNGIAAHDYVKLPMLE